MDPITSFDGEYRWLSNFHIEHIKVDGLWFISVEHAFQAAKSEDPVFWKIIQTTKFPGGAKKLGRTCVLRADWEEIKLEVMETLIEIKFQNAELAHKLIETGDAELIEGNHWGDTFWGVCRGVGENHLGKIIMKVRDSL